jgi:hypothetical protein
MNDQDILGIELAIDLEYGREHCFVIKGAKSALRKLADSIVKSVDSNCDQAANRSDLFWCPILQTSGRQNPSFLVFRVDNDAIPAAARATTGLLGLWNDSKGCLIQILLVALAIKGAFSFF